MTDRAGPVRGAVHPAEDAVVSAVEVEDGGVDRRDSRPVSSVDGDAVVRNRPAEQRHRSEHVSPPAFSEFAERCPCHAGTE